MSNLSEGLRFHKASREAEVLAYLHLSATSNSRGSSGCRAAANRVATLIPLLATVLQWSRAAAIRRVRHIERTILQKKIVFYLLKGNLKLIRSTLFGIHTCFHCIGVCLILLITQQAQH